MDTLKLAVRKLRSSLRTHRRRWIFIGAPLAVALIAAVTYLVWPSSANPAEEAVREYLTAIRDGDAKLARQLTKGSNGSVLEPEDLNTRFLNADALDGGWSIGKIRATGAVTDETATAYVKATISTSEGDSATHVFKVTNQVDAGWSIADPYVYVQFGRSPLPYVDVNGVKHKRELVAEGNEIDTTTFALFPGVYRFYESVPKVIDFDSPAIPLLSGERFVNFTNDQQNMGPGQITLPALTLTKAGQKSAQKLVNDHIDDCAKKTELLTPGCPFGAEYVAIPEEPGDYYDSDKLENIKWKVLDHPTITAVQNGTSFALADRDRGRVELSATGTSDAGITTKTKTKCETRDTTLELELIGKGKLRLFPAGGRTDLDDVDPDGFFWSTCPR